MSLKAIRRGMKAIRDELVKIGRKRETKLQCKQPASSSRLYRFRTPRANKQEYESFSNNIQYRQITGTIYIHTNNNLLHAQSHEQVRLFRVPRQDRERPRHLKASTHPRRVSAGQRPPGRYRGFIFYTMPSIRK